MNRTDRLLAIVLELQGRGCLRAEDLAATFETSKRTIYRDIEALCEAGVPLISTPGRGYTLMEGYFLPPLSFSAAEATILLLGSQVVASSFDDQYRAAATSASRKIEGVLPAPQRTEVQILRERIRFVVRTIPAPEQAAQATVLQVLRQAISDGFCVRFQYHPRYSDATEPTETPAWREVDPYALIHSQNSWYLVAYCHLRQAIRNFRLERLENLEPLEEQTFVRPADFQLQSMKERSERPLMVRVLFDQASIRWMRENRSYYMVAEEETPEGLLVTLQIRQESEVLPWLLSWGQHVRVLEPASLQANLRAEAQRILQQYEPER